MKLAEGLLLRSDMQKKVQSLRDRLPKSTLVQEGDRPAEDPKGLLGELAGVLRELEQLIFKINQANLAARLESGASLTEALAKRDVLVQKHSILSQVVEAARPQGRYGRSEIRWVPQVDAAELQKQADDIAKQIRELNAAIQEAGWSVTI